MHLPRATANQYVVETSRALRHFAQLVMPAVPLLILIHEQGVVHRGTAYLVAVSALGYVESYGKDKCVCFPLAMLVLCCEFCKWFLVAYLCKNT